jgi:coenzyme F420-0:L-glutamate ligase / coenzyme F420-1:gamma-L-glutamate ligase
VREDVLASQTARVVARRGPTRIVVTHHGFVMAAAGVDASNVDPSQLVLLPKDPDGSARSLRLALAERFNVDVAVIISDTMGRPWRNGLTDVALGAAGIEPILDHRGEIDPYGNELQLTEMAVVDELAAAAELVKGKLDQVPVAVVRGYLPGPPPADSPRIPAPDNPRIPAPDSPRIPAADGPGAVALIRDSASDLFSLGTAEARALGLRDAALLTSLPTVPVGIPGLREPLPMAPTTIVEPLPDNVIRLSADPSALVALGIDAHRLHCALAAANLPATLTTPTPTTVLVKITPR